MTPISFVCQQACLFFSEGVRFSGLLNQTGRFVPGSQPDAHTGGGSRRKKKKGNTDGDRGLVEMLCYFLCICCAYGQPWLGYTSVDVERSQFTPHSSKLPP